MSEYEGKLYTKTELRRAVKEARQDEREGIFGVIEKKYAHYLCAEDVPLFHIDEIPWREWQALKATVGKEV
ncbi:hypothetical protein LCGC14_2298560 [marine sediment metagenome]|uniref:Uncharacterized protein n=1 Tax=marine sediment metagenome TaxID=412755 RepID=A0A0F9CPL6_9ZZZZ